MAVRQYTMRVEGFVTFTAEKESLDVPAGTKLIPMKLDVFTKDEDEDSPVIEVVDTDITEDEIVSHTDL